MSGVRFSDHARARMQQRGINPVIVFWLLDYGRVRRSRGADMYDLDKRARVRLRCAIGETEYRRCQKHLDVYVVIADDGIVITVAHRP